MFAIHKCKYYEKTIGIKRNFIIIIISILLSACTKKENASQQALLLELVQAEAVMYEHPDSALGVLQGMKVPAVSDKLQNATWALLTVQAKYKNYKEELADSTLINIAYDYFMKQNNPQRKAMVLYYKGVLYEKADKKNEAQESYLKAIEEVEKTKDYQLAHLIYSSIGNIYLYNSLNEYALQMFKQSLHYAKLSEIRIIYVLHIMIWEKYIPYYLILIIASNIIKKLYKWQKLYIIMVY